MSKKASYIFFFAKQIISFELHSENTIGMFSHISSDNAFESQTYKKATIFNLSVVSKRKSIPCC